MLAGGSLWATGAVARPRPTVLRWLGRARVVAGGRTLDLTVDTRVEPFVRARSRSWITERGEATARTLVIEPADGWLEEGGARRPLPPALVAHERQQYGLYGHLLHALRSPARSGTRRLNHPGYPDAIFRFDAGRPVEARYTVAAPEAGAAAIPQRFVFSDPAPDRALGWPRRILIEQDGRPFFDLAVDRIEAEA